MFRPLILAALTLIVPAASQAATYFAAERHALHAAPSRDSAVVAMLATCTAFEAHGMVDGWLRVQTAQGEAFFPAIRAHGSSLHCHGGPDGGWGGSDGASDGGSDAPA